MLYFTRETVSQQVYEQDFYTTAVVTYIHMYVTRKAYYILSAGSVKSISIADRNV